MSEDGPADQVSRWAPGERVETLPIPPLPTQDELWRAHMLRNWSVGRFEKPKQERTRRPSLPRRGQ